jgi:transposase
VAASETGQNLGQRTLPANAAGHLEALRWAHQRWPQRIWAIEDCRMLSRRLETDLLVAGEAVVRVPTRLMAAARRGARTRGKSDPIDALAVAQAALREPDLPSAQLDGEVRQIRLLVDHREDLVGERTRIQNRLRWHLHELDPGHEPVARSLARAKVLDALELRLADQPGLVARIARDLVARCRWLTREIKELEREIRQLVVGLVPSLLGLHGCGTLSAAKIIGHVVDISRFRSRAAFARYNGTAPIPVWSGNAERFRLNRGGNRQINAALHRIALTQLQRPGPAQDYVAHRRADGDGRRQAIRALRRRLSDEIFRRLRADQGAQRAPLTHIDRAA